MIGINCTFTLCSAQKPAEMPTLKLPGRTGFFITTLLFFPAGDQILLSAALITEKEEYLAFNMRRNGPASLLVTMDCFNRNPEKISELFLCSSQFFSRGDKFIFFHNISSFQP